MKIESNDLDLRGAKVRVNGDFNAILQGSWDRCYLRDEIDYWLEVESAEYPIRRVLASECEMLSEPKKRALIGSACADKGEFQNA